MPPNESITYITHNFKINLFKSFTIIKDGSLEYQGLGTLKKGAEPMNIYRGKGLTLVTKTNGEFVTLLERGIGMDLGIQFLH